MHPNFHRFTLICLVLYLTCASASSRKRKTPSSQDDDCTARVIPFKYEKPKRPKKVRPHPYTVKDHRVLLRDKNHLIDAMERDYNTTLTQDPLRYPICQIDGRFEGLLYQGSCDEITKLAETMEKTTFLERLSSVVTTVEHYKGIVKCLRSHDMFIDFLVQADTALVEKVILEFKRNQPEYYVRNKSDICEAISKSVNEGRYEHVVMFMRVIQTRHTEDSEQGGAKMAYKYKEFIRRCLEKLVPHNSVSSLKRFLINYGKTFSEEHHTIFERFIQGLIRVLKYRIQDKHSNQFLMNLVEQPSLLSPTTFASAFLGDNGLVDRDGFITYGWKEAILEGLNGKYVAGGRHLWNHLLKRFDNTLVTLHPVSAEPFKSAPIKPKLIPQEFEKERAIRITPIILKLTDYLSDILPESLLIIISEYAIKETPRTWPPSLLTQELVLKTIPTKKEREEPWRRRNQEYITLLMECILTFPTVIAEVIAEYAPIMHPDPMIC